MDNASERRLRAELHKLIRHLHDGDITAFRSQLEAGASPELLTTLRENKALLKAPAALRPDAASAMATVAGRLLGTVERDCLTRHLELVRLVADRTESLQAGVEALAASLSVMSFADLLQVAQKAFNCLAWLSAI